tara:strand:- start:207 stop:383 length:177 start_codon:yes stop_codon:yes gene_type:complete
MTVIEITQADRDRNRRKNHFQVRLDDDLADKLRHFMQSRDYNANQALSTIISRFFKNA